MRTVLALLMLALCPAVGRLEAQLPKIEELMSAEELRRTGVGKLTQAELAQLNAWMVRYTRAVLELSSASAGAPSGALPAPSATASVVESRIDGEFTGWEGETIFKLVNGQIWQQDSYAYRYHYAYSPRVTIYRSGAGYKMKVDGVEGEIQVKRLR